MTSVVSALIFDLDGVLWDTADYHVQAFRYVLTPLGIRVPLYHEIAGRRTDAVFEELLFSCNASVNPKLVAELTWRKREQFKILLREKPPNLDATVSVINKLAGRYRLGLCSSASPQSVELFFDITGLGSLFDTVVSGEMVERAKPAPDIYNMALMLLSSSPHAATAIEDSADGIKSAQMAGLRVVGVEGTLPRLTLAELGATWVVKDISELMSFDFADH